MSVSHTPTLLLLTTSGGGIGGTQLVAINLARQFTARGWAVRNVFPQTPQSVALLALCREWRVPAETSEAVRAIQFRRTWRDMVALRQFVRASKPNVVNLHYGVGHIALKDILAVRFAGRHRLVVTVHHPATERMSLRARIMTRAAAMLCHDMVAVSRATRETLRQAGIAERKIHLVPNGLPVPLRLPARTAARARFGLADDAFVIASLARLVREKGIDDLVEATARVPDPEGTLRLVIGGDGPERTALEERAVDRLGGRVAFLGRVPDTADLYAAADVFALPSYMEGFGLVYVEAAFHGVPSIGTAVGGVPDVVVDGETGLLVPPRDPAALAAAIAQVRDDPALRTRLGAAARARACREFTEERMAVRYAELFNP